MTCYKGPYFDKCPDRRMKVKMHFKEMLTKLCDPQDINMLLDIIVISIRSEAECLIIIHLQCMSANGCFPDNPPDGECLASKYLNISVYRIDSLILLCLYEAVQKKYYQEQ